MTDTIIEVSGADFCGKTTQATMLTYYQWEKPAHNFGGFGKYSDRFPANLPPQEDWRWWFQETTPEQLGDVLTSAYNARQHAAASSSYAIGVVERGATMVRAQLAANFATRRNVSVADCAEEMGSIVDARLARPAAARFEFVLEDDAAWLNRIGNCLRYVRSARQLNPDYTAYQNEFYAKYLMNLSSALGHFAAGEDTINVPVDTSAVNVQNAIRHHDALQGLHLPTLLEQDPLIVGIGGMSECGKGTLAQKLADEHGFTRLKLGYFNEVVRANGERYGDPHMIAMNALRFISTNRHLERASFESLYGPHIAAEFKTLLGDRWKAIAIEVSDDERVRRALREDPSADPAEVLAFQRKKDALKLSQGMAEYREVADIHVSNDGSIDTMVETVVKGLGI